MKEKGQTNVTETILAAMVNMHINYLCRTNLNHRETRQLIRFAHQLTDSYTKKCN